MSDSNSYQAPVSTEDAGGPVGPASVATAKTREYLGQAAPWLRFLVVLGYIGLVIVLIAGVGMLFAGSMLTGGVGGPMVGILLAVVYLILAVVLYFPLRILGRLTKGAKRYKVQAEPADLELVAASVKGLAQFYGVFTIVVIAVYIVVIIGAVVFAAAFR